MKKFAPLILAMSVLILTACSPQVEEDKVEEDKEVSIDESIKHYSSDLGVSFDYPAKPDPALEGDVTVAEEGNRISIATDVNPDFNHVIVVYDLDPQTSVEDAIAENASYEDCPKEASFRKELENGYISYTAEFVDQAGGPCFGGGVHSYIYNPKNPSKFIYFGTGHDTFLGEGLTTLEDSIAIEDAN